MLSCKIWRKWKTFSSHNAQAKDIQFFHTRTSTIFTSKLSMHRHVKSRDKKHKSLKKRIFIISLTLESRFLTSFVDQSAINTFRPCVYNLYIKITNTDKMQQFNIRALIFSSRSLIFPPRSWSRYDVFSIQVRISALIL